MTLNLGEQCK